MKLFDKVTTTVKFGGGLNLLCLAGAAYIMAKTLIKLDEWVNKTEQLKELKEAYDVVVKESEE